MKGSSESLLRGPYHLAARLTLAASFVSKVGADKAATAVTRDDLAVAIRRSLESLFGMPGAATLKARVMGFEGGTGKAVIRTSFESAPFVSAGIIFITDVRGIPAALRVDRLGPVLAALCD